MYLLLLQSTLKAVTGIACQKWDLLDISKHVLFSPVSIPMIFTCISLILCIIFLSPFLASKMRANVWRRKEKKPLESVTSCELHLMLIASPYCFHYKKIATEQCKSYDLCRQMVNFSRTFPFLWFNKHMFSTLPVKWDEDSLLLVLPVVTLHAQNF